MKDGTIDELIADLMMKCGFGAVSLPIEPISGGLMHRMYRVKTDSGVYAVKHLNPEIMGREGVLDNYARAEKIECLLEKEGIPIVPAITVSGKKMQHIEGNYFYVFHWQDGHITDWNNISKEMCRTAGNILGRMHARFSIDTLAEKLNISKKTIYKYFPTKEAHLKLLTLYFDAKSMTSSDIFNKYKLNEALYAYTTEQNDDLWEIIFSSLDDSTPKQDKISLRIIVNGSFEKLCNEKKAPDGVIDKLVNILW